MTKLALQKNEKLYMSEHWHLLTGAQSLTMPPIKERHWISTSRHSSKDSSVSLSPNRPKSCLEDQPPYFLIISITPHSFPGSNWLKTSPSTWWEQHNLRNCNDQILVNKNTSWTSDQPTLVSIYEGSKWDWFQAGLEQGVLRWAAYHGLSSTKESSPAKGW